MPPARTTPVTTTPTVRPDAPTPEDYGLPTKDRYTYEDYQQLPEGAPFQLIDGQLVMSPSPAYRHQRIALDLAVALHQFARDQGAGEVLSAPMDVRLGGDVVQPDVLFVADARRALIGEQAIEGAPDLVVEILSPSNAYDDMQTKRLLYERHGVAEYWLVDPHLRTVEVLANAETGFRRTAFAREDGAVASRVLDGFAVDLADLFPA